MAESTCRECGVVFKYKVGASYGIYCSIRHQHDYVAREKYRAWLAGTPPSMGTRSLSYLLKKFEGNKCAVCGITEWNSAPIVMQLDHIDGNHTNNSKENCRLICPNCDSQSPTYKGRNKGNGRHARRERYAAGKSY